MWACERGWVEGRARRGSWCAIGDRARVGVGVVVIASRGFRRRCLWRAMGERFVRHFARLLRRVRGERRASVAMRQGTFAVPTRTTLREAAEAWLAAAEAGVVRTRSGDRYKPSALRSYRASLDARVVPRLGALRLSAVTRPQIQELVDRLVAEGLSASTVRNTVLPLRAIFRRACARAEVAQNPTLGLSLPAVRGRRERVARPDEAVALLRALRPATGRSMPRRCTRGCVAASCVRCAGRTLTSTAT